eukprot:scaffold7349_cov173-Amphora_coffeaeformis.AAC.52
MPVAFIASFLCVGRIHFLPGISRVLDALLGRIKQFLDLLLSFRPIFPSTESSMRAVITH